MGRRTDYAQRPGYGLQEHNADYILKHVMKRERYKHQVHEQLTEVLKRVAAGEKLGRVAAGKPLRVSNNSKKGWATTMKREVGE